MCDNFKQDGKERDRKEEEKRKNVLQNFNMNVHLIIKTTKHNLDKNRTEVYNVKTNIYSHLL